MTFGKNLHKLSIVTLSSRNPASSDMYSLKLFLLNSRVIRNEYSEVLKIFYVLILEGGHIGIYAHTKFHKIYI